MTRAKPKAPQFITVWHHGGGRPHQIILPFDALPADAQVRLARIAEADALVGWRCAESARLLRSAADALRLGGRVSALANKIDEFLKEHEWPESAGVAA